MIIATVCFASFFFCNKKTFSFPFFLAWMGNNNIPGQMPNGTAQVAKPCSVAPPVIIRYIHGSAVGWNAVVRRSIFLFFFYFCFSH